MPIKEVVSERRDSLTEAEYRFLTDEYFKILDHVARSGVSNTRSRVRDGFSLLLRESVGLPPERISVYEKMWRERHAADPRFRALPRCAPDHARLIVLLVAVMAILLILGV